MPDEEIIEYAGEAMIISPTESAAAGIFGNGLHFSVAYIGEPEPNAEGEMEVPILIYPCERLVQIYGIKKELENDGINIQGEYAIWRRYHKNDIIPISTDPRVFNYIILCDFGGRKTKLSELNEVSEDLHRARDRREQGLRATIARYQEEIEQIQRIGIQEAKLIALRIKALESGITRKKDEEEDEDKKDEKD